MTCDAIEPDRELERICTCIDPLSAAHHSRVALQEEIHEADQKRCIMSPSFDIEDIY